MPTRMSRSGRKRKLERPENEQFLSAVRPHILAWIALRQNTKQNSNRLVCVAPSRHSQGLETANGHLSPCVQMCRREVNQNPGTMPGLNKAKISSNVLGPKIASEAISQHQTQTNFLLEQAPSPP